MGNPVNSRKGRPLLIAQQKKRGETTEIIPEKVEGKKTQSAKMSKITKSTSESTGDDRVWRTIERICHISVHLYVRQNMKARGEKGEREIEGIPRERIWNSRKIGAENQ